MGIRRASYTAVDCDAKDLIARKLSKAWKESDSAGFEQQARHSIASFQLKVHEQIFKDPLFLFGPPLDEFPGEEEIDVQWYGGPGSCVTITIEKSLLSMGDIINC